MIEKDLLDILACPDSKEPLELADQELIDRANAKITKGGLLNRAKQKIGQQLDGGLLQKESRKYLYPIIDQIPVLLVDEAITVADIDS